MNQKKPLDLAIDILLVFSWALSFLGFFIGIYLFLPFGILEGICGGIFLAMPGLFSVVVVELFFIQKQNLKLSEQRNQLLKSINTNLSNLHQIKQ